MDLVTDSLGDMALSSGKTAREHERDLLRQARGFAEMTELTSDTVVRKSLRPKTEGHYKVLLREWETFVDEYKRIRPLTEMEEGKDIYNPTNVKTAKDFLAYFYTPRNGILTPEDPNEPLAEAYVFTAWKWFMGAWERQHEMSFTKAFQTTICNHIHAGKEKNALGLSRKKRPKPNFTRNSFVVCMVAHHRGSHEFRHERYRISLHLLTIGHPITSARVGEFESNLRYKDLCIAATWLNDDDPDECRISVDWKRDEAKGLHDRKDEQPIHLLYEHLDKPFMFNAVMLFMAVALGDGVLHDYQTWEQICTIQRPKDLDHVILELNPAKSHWFVFPKCYADGRIDHEKTSSLLASGALKQLGRRAGFTENLTLHAARREILLLVDACGKYSDSARMQFAAHLNPHTYRKSYQTAISAVDGQAAFMGSERGNEALHTLRRSFLWKRNPNRQQKLLAATESVLQENLALTEGNNEPESPQDPKERQKGYDLQRKLRDQLLRAQDGVAAAQGDGPYESNFSQTRKLMPERHRIATNMFAEGSLRDTQGRQLMDDLIQLCKENPSPTYCEGLNASASTCLTCNMTKKKDQEHVWWSHLYSCKKKATRRRGGFAEFCFLCFAWYDDRKTWQEHVRIHLQDPPLWCNMEVFRHNVVRPALCPACLGDKNNEKAPDDRFRQFTNVTAWKDHVLNHVFGGDERRCPHPRCGLLPELTTIDEYINHQADKHKICLRPKERLRVTRKSLSKTQEDPDQGLRFIYVNHTTTTRPAPIVGARMKGDADGVVARPAVAGLKIPKRVHPALLETPSGSRRGRRPSWKDESIQASIAEDGDQPTDSKSDAVMDLNDSNREHNNDKGETLVFNPDLKAGNVEDGVQIQTKSILTKRKGPSVVINVPPVPEDWIRKRRKLESKAQRAIPTVFTESIGTSERRQTSGRGRPAGSQNKKTLLRARRRAVIERSRRTNYALES